MTEYMAAGSIGFAFGWLLQKAGLSRFDRIAGVYRFADLAVIQFLLSALVTGAVCVRGLVALGLSGSIPVPPTYLAGNLAGGVLFGVGMAASGFCPGTVAVGAGEGRLDYLLPGMLGLVAGALGFGFVYPSVFRVLGRSVQPGLTLPSLLGADPWLVVILITEIALIVFYAIGRRRWNDGPAQSLRRGADESPRARPEKR